MADVDIGIDLRGRMPSGRHMMAVRLEDGAENDLREDISMNGEG